MLPPPPPGAGGSPGQWAAVAPVIPPTTVQPHPERHAPPPPTPGGTAFPAAEYRAVPAPESDPAEQITVEPSHYVVSIKAMVVAGLVAFVGVGLWIVLSSVSSMRLMMLPWGLGALIGWSSMRAGGRGLPMGLLCAVIILVAGLVGRFGCLLAGPDLFYVPPAVPKGMKEVAQAYDDLSRTMAATYGTDSVPVYETEDDLRWFLFDNGLTNAASPEEITREEIIQWKNQSAARERAAFEPGAGLVAVVKELEAAQPKTPWEVYTFTFGPWDFIWIFFGMLSAFLIGGAREGSL